MKTFNQLLNEVIDHRAMVAEAETKANKITLVHQGDGGHHRITVGKIHEGPNAGKHYVDAKFDNSRDPKKPSGHGSNQSLSNYTATRRDEGSSEASKRLHNALVDAHKTGDKHKVLKAMKDHGYSHHNWKIHEE